MRLHRRTTPFMILDVVIIAVLLTTHITIFGLLLSTIASILSASALFYVLFSAYRFRKFTH